MSSNNATRCWRWQGIDAQGHTCTGLVLAQTPDDVAKQLRTRHILVCRLRRIWHVPTLSTTQLTMWLQKLAHLLTAGLPMDTIITLLQTQNHNAAHYRFTTQIGEALTAGHSLSYALSHTAPSQEDTTLLALSQAGEANGTLADVLTRLVAQRQRQAAWRSEWRKRTRYPLVLLVSGLAITIMLLSQVVPSFAQLYAQQQRALPPLTQALLTLSHHVDAVGFGVLGVLILLGVLLSQRHRKGVIFLLHCLPIMGPLHREDIACELLQLIQLGQHANLSLDRFLDRLRTHYRQRPYLHDVLTTVLYQLHSGVSLSDALQQCRAGQHPLIAHEQQHLILLGERSGRLPIMLKQAIDMLEHTREQRLARLALWLEPLLMSVLALGIGTVMLGMYLPIFDMGEMAW